MRSLPTNVQPIVDAFRTAIEGEAPGLLEGLYIVGSIALDDFRPQRSDVDFVAVTTQPLDTVHIERLTRIHADIQQRWRRPFFDGIYVTRDDLARDPRTLQHCVVAHEGKVQPNAEGDLIAWHMLAQSGLRLIGPPVGDLPTWTNERAVADWTNENLDAFWLRRMLDRSASLLTRFGLVSLSAWFCEWCVTGVPRLHYTLATGAIASKEQSAVYARATFTQRWHRVIDEGLRIRRGEPGASLYRSPLARRRDVRAFMAMVIEDAHRLYQQRANDNRDDRSHFAPLSPCTDRAIMSAVR